jgi:hypothetical protein
MQHGYQKLFPMQHGYQELFPLTCFDDIFLITIVIVKDVLLLAIN